MKKFTREDLESWGIDLPPENKIWGWDIVAPLCLGCGLFGFVCYLLGMPAEYAVALSTIILWGIAIKHGQ